MPYMIYKRHSVYYEINGKKDQPLIIFINGLTQNTALWGVQTEQLNELGYQTLTFDLLGQGKSFKPILSINFDENVDVLHQLGNLGGIGLIRIKMHIHPVIRMNADKHISEDYFPHAFNLDHNYIPIAQAETQSFRRRHMDMALGADYTLA